ncbi:MAG TPA: lipopolysaccharide kinase InaA family protein [Opitutales bacterium]|nr:lipopolysaccharide kinase InaA family protein [Opitutales bacterium]
MSARFDKMEVVQSEAGFALKTLSLQVDDSLRVLPGRREVFSACVAELAKPVVVKCYLPHAKQARDWGREWQGLLSLQNLKLPAPEPLAVARNERCEICVVMERIDGALTLGAFLNGADDAASGPLMTKLARLVGSLHEAGVRQNDQHIDNWAVAQGGIFLLDAGTFEFDSKPLSDQGRLEDLAAICATLPPRAEGAFRHALSGCYGIHEPGGRTWFREEDLDEAIAKLQQARARKYFKKTQRDCSEFASKASEAGAGMFTKSADSGLVDRFFRNPGSLMAEGRRLKSGNTCTVQRFESGGCAYVLKRYNVKPLPTQLRRSLGSSRARLSWANSWVLHLAFVPTAKSLAFLDESGFPRGRSYLLMQSIDAELLPDYVARISEDPAKLSDLVEAVGCVWDRLGRLRAVHGDLKASNWMVNQEGTVFLFDLDSFRFALSEMAFRRGRKKDLRRFLKNWPSAPEIADAFRRRMEGVEA